MGPGGEVAGGEEGGQPPAGGGLPGEARGQGSSILTQILKSFNKFIHHMSELNNPIGGGERLGARGEGEGGAEARG